VHDAPGRRDAHDESMYLALGDSTAVGVGATDGLGYPARLAALLAAAGTPVTLRNLGESGATTGELARRQLPRLPRERPELVTLGIGTNDLWRMIPLERIARELDAIGAALAKTGAPVLVSNVIDLSLAPIRRMVEMVMNVPMSAFHERLDALNAALATMTRTHGFELVDLCGYSRATLPAHPDYFSSDGFHPSAAGYAAWAELLLAPAEKALRARRT
jgi:acyl-CoA thioesterase I